MKTKISNFLLKNKNWSSEKEKVDINYFTKLFKEQKPSIFWIGCCDSRVIPNKILNLPLGSVSVHTNIANQVNYNDANLISALTYAVNILKVEHVIVCGHTCCGGVQAAIDNNAPEAVKEWVKPLRAIYKKNNILNNNDLSELNVKTQAQKISQHKLFKNNKNSPQIHAWIFKIENGTIFQLKP